MHFDPVTYYVIVKCVQCNQLEKIFVHVCVENNDSNIAYTIRSIACFEANISQLQ